MYDIYIGFNGSATRWVSEIMENLQKLFTPEGVKALYSSKESVFAEMQIQSHPDELSLLQRTKNGQPLVKACWLLVPPDDQGPYYHLTAQAAIAFSSGIPVRVCMCDQGQSEDSRLAEFIRQNNGSWSSFISTEQMIDHLLKATRPPKIHVESSTDPDWQNAAIGLAT